MGYRGVGFFLFYESGGLIPAFLLNKHVLLQCLFPDVGVGTRLNIFFSQQESSFHEVQVQ